MTRNHAKGVWGAAGDHQSISGHSEDSFDDLREW
jgi:hypothetical protein